MIKIGVISNRDKDIEFNVTSMLVKSIRDNGAQPLLDDNLATALNDTVNNLKEEEVVSAADIIVCLGGDGTFLKSARKVFHKDIPILGVNLGNLGFLTVVDRNEIDPAIKCLVNGNYSIEERMMLETSIIRDNKEIMKDIVLNDVVISRGWMSRILHLKTYINDQFVDLYPGDGLIISTPTGSTAYSLSAGGPIVDPDISLIIATPICPHLLYSRSFITTGDKILKVLVAENDCHGAMVTVDGQNGYELQGGDSIITRKSSRCLKMVKLSDRNFFDVLRSKIYDRGEKIK